MRYRAHLVVLALIVSSCAEERHEETAQPAAAPSLSRADFNRAATLLAKPFFWSDDKNQDGKLDPSELALVFGLSDGPRDTFVANGGFTTAFDVALAEMTAFVKAKPAAVDPLRDAALEKEAGQSYFTLLDNDFAGGTAEDKAIVEHVVAASRLVERLYAKQVGSYGLDAKLDPRDPVAKLVYFINQGPWCSGPMTESDPNCNALADKPAKISGLYPAKLQADKGFCQTLEKRKDAEQLFHQFSVVTEDDKGELRAVPYNEYYKDDMTAVSAELKAAAQAITSPGEQAFKAYLEAAAQAFLDNEWPKADEAWAKMNAENSKWYLRIGPDEVYYEPCSRKAGFHVSFARINPGSLEWQKKLEPVKAEMEKALADHAGKPYKARDVSFHLPDFIDVVLNAGDSRDARGATIGQSLPNWGPVANEGRGRTVVMTNFYTDPDSKRILRERVETMLCKDSLPAYNDDQTPQLMSTVLHEAAHNLGPAHEYKVGGKTDDQVFGGPLASTLEELKAQTSALYFTDWLVAKNLASPELGREAHVRDVSWSLGHIARGMYDSEHKPKPYSQLASIQMGFLMKEGAITWRKDELAANGKDQGCLGLDLAKFPAAIDKLTTTVLGVKGRGDKKLAEQLKKEFVDDPSTWHDVAATTAERYRRFPLASFLYSVRY